jgi:hypothetical protein
MRGQRSLHMDNPHTSQWDEHDRREEDLEIVTVGDVAGRSP